MANQNRERDKQTANTKKSCTERMSIEYIVCTIYESKREHGQNAKGKIRSEAKAKIIA